MIITINGGTRELKSAITLEELIKLLDFQGKRLAVEVNEDIIPRSQYGSFRLSENDRVEIVHAIGGG